MSFRVSALAAVAAVLGLASVTPSFAQPQPPVRPRYSQFQAVFRPGASPLIYPGQGFLGQNVPYGSPYGPQVPGFVYPQAGYAPGPYGLSPYGVAPAVVATSVPATFGNLGHWYSVPYGNYGHWYPNGVASGRGIIGYGTGFPAGGGLLVGPGGGMGRSGGSVLGTAATLGATVGTFRR
jgi:hypothetical protein